MSEQAPVRRSSGQAPERRDPAVGRRVRNASVAAIVLAAAAAGIADARLVRTEALETHAQPDTVYYPDGHRHYVGVRHQRSLLLDRHRSYELYAGGYRDLSYGHLVTLGFPPAADQPTIDDVIWEKDGVRVGFASGHEMFLPARLFMYGR